MSPVGATWPPLFLRRRQAAWICSGSSSSWTDGSPWGITHILGVVVFLTLGGVTDVTGVKKRGRPAEGECQASPDEEDFSPPSFRIVRTRNLAQNRF